MDYAKKDPAFDEDLGLTMQVLITACVKRSEEHYARSADQRDIAFSTKYYEQVGKE
jgi:hypothetical protein